MRKKERLRLEREALDAKVLSPIWNGSYSPPTTAPTANWRRGWSAPSPAPAASRPPSSISARAAATRKRASAMRRRKGPRSNPTRIPRQEIRCRRIEWGRFETARRESREVATTLEAHPDEEKPGSVEVTARQQDSSDPEAIANEARKGYDLLVIGVAKTRNPKAEFSKDVSRIADEFDGPLAIVDSHRDTDRPKNRLWPDSDSGQRHRSVAPRVGGRARFGARHRRECDGALCHPRKRERRNGKAGPRRRATRRNEQAVFKDIHALAERYEVDLRMRTRANVAPDKAILDESKHGYDLNVLGVSRRPGDTLHFGNTATAVLDRSNVSNLSSQLIE